MQADLIALILSFIVYTLFSIDCQSFSFPTQDKVYRMKPGSVATFKWNYRLHPTSQSLATITCGYISPRVKWMLARYRTRSPTVYNSYARKVTAFFHGPSMVGFKLKSLQTSDSGSIGCRIGDIYSRKYIFSVTGE